MHAFSKPHEADSRGVDLLLQHCRALDRPDESRPTPFDRLADEVGPELATMLVSALSAADRTRSRGLYAA